MLEKLFWLLANNHQQHAKKQVFSLVLAEMKSRLTEEIYYEVEASNRRWLQQKIKLDGIVIPKVEQKLSSASL